MSTSLEELALAAQGGDQEALLRLWQGVRRFAFAQTRKYPLTEQEDLMQGAFEGLCSAVSYYDASRGARFISLYAQTLRTAFRLSFFGGTGLRAQMDPIHGAGSLDAPLKSDEPDGATLGDFVPDDAAEAAFDGPEIEERSAAIRRALDALDERERDIIRLRYFAALTGPQAAERLHITATEVGRLERAALRKLRHPAISRGLRKFV